MVYLCRTCESELPTPLHEPEGVCDTCFCELRDEIVEAAIEYFKLVEEKDNKLHSLRALIKQLEG